MEKYQLGKKLILDILVLILVILFFSTLATFYSSFWQIWWFDIVMHLLGGIWAGLFFLYLFSARKQVFNDSNFILNLLGAISFAALVGVIWEIYEFSFDQLIAMPRSLVLSQPSLNDTIKDLFNDLTGGFIAATYYWIRYK